MIQIAKLVLFAKILTENKFSRNNFQKIGNFKQNRRKIGISHKIGKNRKNRKT